MMRFLPVRPERSRAKVHRRGVSLAASVCVLAAVALASTATAQIVNGDFSDGLNGWTVVQPAQSKPLSGAPVESFGIERAESLPEGPAVASLAPTHGWQIHAFNGMANFLVAATETPTEEGHILQVFSCGEAGEGRICRVTLDYRLINHEGNPLAARIKIYLDGQPRIVDGTLSEDLGFLHGAIVAPCGEHELKLCLEVDTGISSWTANFDNVVAECVDEVPVRPTTWGRLKARP